MRCAAPRCPCTAAPSRSTPQSEVPAAERDCWGVGQELGGRGTAAARGRARRGASAEGLPTALRCPALKLLAAPARLPAPASAERFSRSGIELVLNSRVKGVRDGAVTVVDKENNVRLWEAVRLSELRACEGVARGGSGDGGGQGEQREPCLGWLLCCTAAADVGATWQQAALMLWAAASRARRAAVLAQSQGSRPAPPPERPPPPPRPACRRSLRSRLARACGPPAWPCTPWSRSCRRSCRRARRWAGWGRGCMWSGRAGGRTHACAGAHRSGGAGRAPLPPPPRPAASPRRLPCCAASPSTTALPRPSHPLRRSRTSAAR